VHNVRHTKWNKRRQNPTVWNRGGGDSSSQWRLTVDKRSSTIDVRRVRLSNFWRRRRGYRTSTGRLRLLKWPDKNVIASTYVVINIETNRMTRSSRSCWKDDRANNTIDYRILARYLLFINTGQRSVTMTRQIRRRDCGKCQCTSSWLLPTIYSNGLNNDYYLLGNRY